MTLNTGTTTLDADAIRAAIDAVLVAFAARDASAVVASYAPDAIIFDLAPPLSRRPLEAEIAAWIDTWRGPLVRTVRELGLDVSGDLAVWHGFVHTAATTLGGEDAAWWERATLVFRRTAAGWRVVQEHTSVPFRMDGSFIAATDLVPEA
jgi:ketosteroid isomerase-like protein